MRASAIVCLLGILFVAGAGFAQELDARGGIDGFGYYWVDSEERDGPEYNRIETPEGAEEIDDMGDDDSFGPVDLPWNFSFYDNEYDEIYICSNGFLKFGGGSNEPNNHRLPNENNPDNIIALYWADLDPSEEGTIYYGEDEDGNWHCQFIEVSIPQLENILTGEIILFEDGSIIFQYSEVPEFDEGERFATLGIENDDGTIGLHIFPEEQWQYPYENLAIRISLLETDATVSGSITDEETGESIADAHIEFSYWDDENQYTFAATSDDDGNYELALLSGTYWVAAFAEGFGIYQADDVEIDEGENTYNIEMGPPPEISIDPDELELFAAPGARGEPVELTVANEGGSELFFFFDIWEDNPEPREWLWVEPWEGVVEPGEEIEVEFTADATHLEVGEYEMNARIWSNDPANDWLDLPITLIVGAEPPAEFDLLSPEDEEALGTGHIELTWEESEEVTPGVPVTYDIYVSDNPDNPGEPIRRNIEETSWLFNAETNGTFYWTVYARVINDVGTWASSTWSFTAGLQPPESFDLLLPADDSAHDPGDIILVWQTPHDPDNDELTYDLYISTDPDHIDDPFQTGLTESFFVFNTTDEYEFYWTVHAYDNLTDGTRATSIWSFAVGDAVGVPDNLSAQIPDKFAIQSIYPNPFNPDLTAVIALPQTSELKVRIYNTLGEQVAVLADGIYSGGYHKIFFQAQTLSSGIYFIHARVPGKMNVVRKVVLIR